MFSVYLRWQSKRPPSQKVCGLNPREEIIVFLLSTQVKSLDFFYLSLFITGLKGRPAYLFFSFLFLLHFFQLVFNLLQFVILTFQFFLQVVYGSHSGLIFILVAFTLQFQNDSTSYLYIPIFRVLKPKTFAFLRCHATTLPCYVTSLSGCGAFCELFPLKEPAHPYQQRNRRLLENPSRSERFLEHFNRFCNLLDKSNARIHWGASKETVIRRAWSSSTDFRQD